MLNRRQIRRKTFQIVYEWRQQMEHSHTAFESRYFKKYDDLCKGYYDLLYLYAQAMYQLRSTFEEVRSAEKAKFTPNQSKIAFLERMEALSGFPALIEWVDTLDTSIYWTSLKNELPLYLEQTIALLWEKEEEGMELGQDQSIQHLSDVFEYGLLAHEGLYEALIHINIHWGDDFASANTELKALLKGVDEEKSVEFKKNFAAQKFGKKLLESVVSSWEEWDAMIDKQSTNWKLDRIATIDGILIKLGLSEFVEFETIPFTVTINEYIEMAKDYSGPKSSVFVNGILDALKLEVKEKYKLLKM